MSRVPNSSAPTRNNKPSHCIHNALHSKSSTTMTLLHSPSPNRVTADAGRLSSSRQRQHKKDESIRKKAEYELSKRSRVSTQGAMTLTRRPVKRIAGTVSALRPAPALTAPRNALVSEAVKMMVAKRRDCVLVVDSTGHLCGIITARDLAYRVVACNMDTRCTTLADIMTRSPAYVTPDTPVSEALDVMVARRVRQLPVCSSVGDIFGLLDMTKYLQESLDTLEKTYGLPYRLNFASEDAADCECTSCAQHSFSNKVVWPSLATVIQHHPPPPCVRVSIKAQIRDVARRMHESGAAAALVYDDDRDLAGIVTSKDIVLRVVAAGLKPDNCSVVRVITPHPDVTTSSTNILDAFKMMNDGPYLKLPIIDTRNNRIEFVVDAMQLVLAASKECQCLIPSTLQNRLPRADIIGSSTASTQDTMSKRSSLLSHSQVDQTSLEPPTPHPAGYTSKQMRSQQTVPAQTYGCEDHSSHPLTPSLQQEATTVYDRSYRLGVPHTETLLLQEDTFPFKFSDGITTHRFRWDYTDFAGLQAIVWQKLAISSWHPTATYTSPASVAIAYRDDEDDQVLMTCDVELLDAVQVALKAGQNCVRLVVHSLEKDAESTIQQKLQYMQIKQTEPTSSPTSASSTCISSPVATCADDGEEKDDFDYPSSTILAISSDGEDRYRFDAPTIDLRRKQKDSSTDIEQQHHTDSIWISDHLLLPTTISFLSVAIVSVFSMGR